MGRTIEKKKKKENVKSTKHGLNRRCAKKNSDVIACNQATISLRATISHSMACQVGLEVAVFELSRVFFARGSTWVHFERKVYFVS